MALVGHRWADLLEAHEGEIQKLQHQNQLLFSENQSLRQKLRISELSRPMVDEMQADIAAGGAPCALSKTMTAGPTLMRATRGNADVKGSPNHRTWKLKSRWSTAKDIWSKQGAAAMEEVYPANRAMKKERTLFRFSSRRMRQTFRLQWFFPLHPNGRMRLTWDVTSLLFLSYDVFYIPFTALDPPDTQFTEVVVWSGLIFWSLDMLMSNVTAFYLRGELVTSCRAISGQYLRTWFCLDLLVIVPDWFGQLSIQSMEGDSVRVLRSLLRSLRCLRLLRLLKLQKLLAMVYDLIDSELTFIAFTCFRLIFGIFILTHFIACIWYYLGESMARSGVASWTSSETGQDPPVQQRDLLYRYTTSMHWSLTQFTPASMEITARNAAERAFSIIVLFVSLLIFSSVIGQVTTPMMSLQNLQANAKKDFWRLRRFLRNRQVPPASRTRIIRYLEKQVYKDRGHVQQKDVKILTLLSEPLKNLLAWELHRKLLTKHRLFDVLQQCIEPMVVRLTSVAVSESALAEQDVIFCAGETADSMSFVHNGSFLYQPAQETQVQRELSNGEWFVEACLWTDWHHLGTMVTLQAGELCHLEPEKFADVMQMHMWPWELCFHYAVEFLALLNAQDVSRRSDLFWHPNLQDEVNIRNLCATEPDDVHQDLDDYFENQ